MNVWFSLTSTFFNHIQIMNIWNLKYCFINFDTIFFHLICNRLIILVFYRPGNNTYCPLLIIQNIYFFSRLRIFYRQLAFLFFLIYSVSLNTFFLTRMESNIFRLFNFWFLYTTYSAISKVSIIIVFFWFI